MEYKKKLHDSDTHAHLKKKQNKTKVEDDKTKRSLYFPLVPYLHSQLLTVLGVLVSLSISIPRGAR